MDLMRQANEKEEIEMMQRKPRMIEPTRPDAREQILAGHALGSVVPEAITDFLARNPDLRQRTRRTTDWAQPGTTLWHVLTLLDESPRPTCAICGAIVEPGEGVQGNRTVCDEHALDAYDE